MICSRRRHSSDQLIERPRPGGSGESLELALGCRDRRPGAEPAAVNDRDADRSTIEMERRDLSLADGENLAVYALTNWRRSGVERGDILLALNNPFIFFVKLLARGVRDRRGRGLREGLSSSPGDLSDAVGSAEGSGPEYAPADLRRRLAEYESLADLIHHATLIPDPVSPEPVAEDPILERSSDDDPSELSSGREGWIENHGQGVGDGAGDPFGLADRQAGELGPDYFINILKCRSRDLGDKFRGSDHPAGCRRPWIKAEVSDPIEAGANSCFQLGLGPIQEADDPRRHSLSETN